MCHALHSHMFKLAFTQSLKQTDCHALKSLAETMLVKTDNNAYNEQNLVMRDEVHIHLTSVINTKFPYWTPLGDNPYIIHEKLLHDLYVTI